jgi:hypothetical protein
LGKKANIVRKNTKALPEANREVGLEVSTVKTKYTVVSRHQNGGQYHNLVTEKNALKMWEISNM